MTTFLKMLLRNYKRWIHATIKVKFKKKNYLLCECCLPFPQVIRPACKTTSTSLALGSCRSCSYILLALQCRPSSQCLPWTENEMQSVISYTDVYVKMHNTIKQVLTLASTVRNSSRTLESRVHLIFFMSFCLHLSNQWMILTLSCNRASSIRISVLLFFISWWQILFIRTLHIIEKLYKCSPLGHLCQSTTKACASAVSRFAEGIVQNLKEDAWSG